MQKSASGSSVARLLNSTTLLIPVDRSHPCRYILGATYVAGGYAVPVSRFREVMQKYKLPQALITYCECAENDYMLAEDLKSCKRDPYVPKEYEFLLKHQKLAHAIATICPKYAFFMDTGTGKTATMLSVIDRFSEMDWVVVCPKAIMRTAWRDDAEKFFPEMRVFVWDVDMKKAELQATADRWGISYNHKTSKDDLFKRLQKYAKVIVINPEQFVRHSDELPKDGFIIDESTIIKNPSSLISRTVDKFITHCDRVYVLSGEPAPNGTEDYFHQIKVLDPGILGVGYTSFKNRYFIPCGYMGYDITPKEGAVEDIMRKVSDISYMVKKEECLDLPAKTYETREYALNPASRKMYKQMLDDFLTMAEGMDDLVMVFNKAGSLMKLRQIASGFLLDENGQAHAVHNDRLSLLDETLEEIGKKQVIIWAQFRYEIESIKAMLGDKACTAYGGTKDLQDSIDGFKNGKYQYIIAHPATLKFGVTFTNCSYAVYYSYDYNYESYYQSHDRIYRMGQTLPCTFITLKCRDTIDEQMLRAVRNKASLAAFMADVIRDAKSTK